MILAMSLRGRLLLVLVMAAVALTAAVIAIQQALSQTDATRERNGVLAVEGLARNLARRPPAEQSNAAAQAVLGSAPDEAAGFCDGDGAITAWAATGALGEPVDHPLPPDLREAIVERCRQAASSTARIRHPHDVALVAQADLGSGRAWAVVRVHTLPASERTAWPWAVAILGAATLALSAVTVDALRALRGGAAQLTRSLDRLRDDLRAHVERPRAEELGHIADGLGAMATHLADANERERRLEKQLAHQQRLASLGRVAAGLAHEVRNPLAGLKLRLDIVRRSGKLDAANNEEVQGALAEVDRLDRLVGSLLSVARRTPTRTHVDLAELAGERAALLGAWAAERSVTLVVSGDASAETDRDAVARVVDNLLRNAVEASPPGAVNVTVSGGEVAAITVADRGAGTGDEAALFEPFFTTKLEGTGLGLFIARSLIEAVGGTITYGREDSWTKMTITLPTS